MKNPFMRLEVGQRVQAYNSNTSPPYGSIGTIEQMQEKFPHRLYVRWDHGGCSGYDIRTAHRDLIDLEDERRKNPPEQKQEEQLHRVNALALEKLEALAGKGLGTIEVSKKGEEFVVFLPKLNVRHSGPNLSRILRGL